MSLSHCQPLCDSIPSVSIVLRHPGALQILFIYLFIIIIIIIIIEICWPWKTWDCMQKLQKSSSNGGLHYIYKKY